MLEQASCWKDRVQTLSPRGGECYRRTSAYNDSLGRCHNRLSDENRRSFCNRFHQKIVHKVSATHIELEASPCDFAVAVHSSPLGMRGSCLPVSEHLLLHLPSTQVLHLRLLAHALFLQILEFDYHNAESLPLLTCMSANMIRKWQNPQADPLILSLGRAVTLICGHDGSNERSLCILRKSKSETKKYQWFILHHL